MRRYLIVLLAGLAAAACESPLPTPQYVEQPAPPPFRVGPDGLRVDNAGYRLDAEGYRIDERGNRVGLVPPTRDDPSNAVAGYWIAEQYQR
ncbi:MAG TPA: hypothetical protein VEC14_05180 [Reyranellaceae bacterium]|nr:hypothetical protein [Reyranellaceae bacterium]